MFAGYLIQGCLSLSMSQPDYMSCYCSLFSPLWLGEVDTILALLYFEASVLLFCCVLSIFGCSYKNYLSAFYLFSNYFVFYSIFSLSLYFFYWSLPPFNQASHSRWSVSWTGRSSRNFRLLSCAISFFLQFLYPLAKGVAFSSKQVIDLRDIINSNTYSDSQTSFLAKFNTLKYGSKLMPAIDSLVLSKFCARFRFLRLLRFSTPSMAAILLSSKFSIYKCLRVPNPSIFTIAFLCKSRLTKLTKDSKFSILVMLLLLSHRATKLTNCSSPLIRPKPLSYRQSFSFCYGRSASCSLAQSSLMLWSDMTGCPCVSVWIYCCLYYIQNDSNYRKCKVTIIIYAQFFSSNCGSKPIIIFGVAPWRIYWIWSSCDRVGF